MELSWEVFGPLRKERQKPDYTEVSKSRMLVKGGPLHILKSRKKVAEEDRSPRIPCGPLSPARTDP